MRNFVPIALVLAAGCARGPSPTGTYTSYREALAKAKSFDDLYPFMDKATRAKIEAAPAEERKAGFEMGRALSEVVEVKVAKETVTGETAVVEASGVQAVTGSDAVATVRLVKEDGAWKIAQESWKRSQAEPPQRTCPELAGDLAGASEGARFRAGAALGQRPCPEAIPALATALQSPSKAMRSHASQGLRTALREEDPAKHAALLPAVLAAKTAAAARQDTSVAINLQSVAGGFGAPAIPALVEDLKSPSRDLRWGAANLLGRMGSAAKDALPALQAAAAGEQDKTVAEQMAEAVRMVQG
jgi:HEAT repeat protein